MGTHKFTIENRRLERFTISVSEGDRHLADGHKWHVVRIGNAVYVTARIEGRTTYLHRLVMGLAHGDSRQVDHINRNGLDNRRENLRIATDALNRQNFSASGYKNNTSGYRGVSWSRERQRWVARCTMGGRTKLIGRFEDVHDAGLAVADYRRQHMPFATD